MSENLSQTQANGSRIRNILIAIAAIALSITFFLGIKTESGTGSLEQQAKNSTPLDVALSNGKPTLTEFYANWCTTCQSMAGDLDLVKKKYANSVNFVMLNVDNSKWLPEILRYRVDGIPHFVFIDNEGKAIAETIGEQPRSVLEADLDALVANRELPYAYSEGRVSELRTPTPNSTTSDDPRSHGAQVQK